jgi:hypothetical protein
MVQPGPETGERAGPVLRGLRAGLLAGATLWVACWAHASADGNLPGWFGLATLWLLGTAVAAALLARPASYARVLTLVVAGQFGLHLLLALMAGHGPRPPTSAAASYYESTSMLAEPGSSAVGHAGGDAGALTSGLGALVGELTSTEGLRMTAAHLVAASVVGVWLATGERVLWFCLRRIAYATRAGLAGALRRILETAALSLRPEPVVEPGWFDRAVDLRMVDWLTAAPRRGPPVVSSC